MWFSVSLLFKSIHEPATHKDMIWEERIVLIESSNAQAAQLKAEELGHSEVVSYRNVKNEKVTWKFNSVLNICEIDFERLTHGSELFSRFLKDSEVRSLKESFED